VYLDVYAVPMVCVNCVTICVCELRDHAACVCTLVCVTCVALCVCLGSVLVCVNCVITSRVCVPLYVPW